tara:strand:+ start:1654 stop:1902 length:249 start_codon:yes stop_codon:yes gene_type:complete
MGVGGTAAHPATHHRNTHDMTKEQLYTEIAEWKQKFETADAEASRYLKEKILFRGQVEELLEENIKLAKACLELTHAANDNK